jgi:hypothetical protein
VTPEEHIAKMTIAIKQAIKVMGDRFGSTERDVARAIEDLKTSMQVASPSQDTAAGPAPAPFLNH